MRIPACFAVLLLAAPAHADIYKCVDGEGRVTYTNQKTSAKGCTLLSQDQAVSTIPGPAPAARQAAAPGAFPRVDGSTQRKRDDERRRILEQELTSEKGALEEARKALAEQEAVRHGDERNYQRVLDRLQPFKDKVAQHERNVDALEREISNLR